MPRSKSVLKRQRQAEGLRVRNKSVRSELRTLEGKVRSAPDAPAARAELKALQKGLDQAAAKGVIHPNKAARKKSRLEKQASKRS
jgi:small subunit ribosomal protein S20